MEEKKKEIWKEILKYDSNFVNAYLILINHYDYKNDCSNFNKYFKKWKDNYKWVNSKMDALFNLKKFKNCWKKINIGGWLFK
jgi:GTPase involved in cell partitioning and DNA repair